MFSAKKLIIRFFIKYLFLLFVHRCNEYVLLFYLLSSVLYTL
nr:MAG TPA: hypothetical protein [Caudoviricetes sp.]